MTEHDDVADVARYVAQVDEQAVQYRLAEWFGKLDLFH